MKLYYHPASTTSRIVQMFAMDQGVDLDYQVVDLFTGEHLQPAFASINPNCLVPVLEDGDFRLTECSAILKYLGDKVGSPAYPKDLKERARVHEMMDWFNSNIYKDFGYGMVYPQTFPHHKRPSDAVQAGTLEWGKQKTQAWLRVLNDSLIGPDKEFLCGNQITLADYMGAEMIGMGALIGCSYEAYPNVQRWMGNMMALEHWPKVHEGVDGFAASLKDKSFVAL
ncbi:glutathione S-transferase family protein [Ramlibacter sp. WS9]|uniref:glutathione S-transferase family protein n=1 Tax=Ramlibacter sp. WS9 TaxID=1882741 RepID=UPI001141B1DA|nr:glutathione S-transferase family protein [Ramlibacter sp. WS9]ROZ79843.1 glutathione S-transferase family protein [Ramlibacter sp. WS9]